MLSDSSHLRVTPRVLQLSARFPSLLIWFRIFGFVFKVNGKPFTSVWSFLLRWNLCQNRGQTVITKELLKQTCCLSSKTGSIFLQGTVYLVGWRLADSINHPEAPDSLISYCLSSDRGCFSGMFVVQVVSEGVVQPFRGAFTTTYFFPLFEIPPKL
jgi:hypothetical protein